MLPPITELGVRTDMAGGYRWALVSHLRKAAKMSLEMSISANPVKVDYLRYCAFDYSWILQLPSNG